MQLKLNGDSPFAFEVEMRTTPITFEVEMGTAPTTPHLSSFLCSQDNQSCSLISGKMRALIDNLLVLCVYCCVLCVHVHRWSHCQLIIPTSSQRTAHFSIPKEGEEEVFDEVIFGELGECLLYASTLALQPV